MAAALVGHELAPRDAVQPRRRGAALGGEAPAPVEGGGKGLGREVGGQLGAADAPAEVGDDAAHVQAVELRERLGVVGGGDQQGVVVAVGLHDRFLRAGPQRVTGGLAQRVEQGRDRRVPAAARAHGGDDASREPALGGPREAHAVGRRSTASPGTSATPWPAATSASTTRKSLERATMRGSKPAARQAVTTTRWHAVSR